MEFTTLVEFYGYNKVAAAEVTSSAMFGWVYQLVHNMAKIAEKEAQQRLAASKKASSSGSGPGGGAGGADSDSPKQPAPPQFGKKIAQGQDPLASLASAMKLGSQIAKKR